MKIRLASLLALFGPLASFAQSDSSPNRVYVGPNIFYRSYHENLNPPFKSDDFGPFFGLVFGYDYRKSNMIYGAVDLGYSWGNVTYDGSILDFENQSVYPKRSDSNNQIFNVETRIGYTFSPRSLPELMITPYLGIGYLQWNRDIKYDETYNWEYVPVGLYTTYDVTQVFTVGLNAKAMRMVNGKIHINLDSSSIHLHLGNRWQYGFEFPFIFNLDTRKIWDVRFIPYFYKKNIGKSNDKLVSIYIYPNIKVEEPSSSTYETGAKIEIGYSF